jgi:hypothetical protein
MHRGTGLGLRPGALPRGACWIQRSVVRQGPVAWKGRYVAKQAQARSAQASIAKGDVGACKSAATATADTGA